MKMPVLFIGHGSPNNAIEDNRFTEAWKSAMKDLQPKGICIVSAHWVSHQLEMTTNTHPAMIYDMYGFQNALYELVYPAHTSEELIHKIRACIPNVKDNDKRGIDHGVWSILHQMVPHANIPMVEVSLNAKYDFKGHYEVGKKLAALREEGILIIGSGNIVHNLRLLNWSNDEAFTWALDVHDHVNEALMNHDDEAIIHVENWGEDALQSINTGEHYVPLLICLGASEHDEVTIFNNEIIMGSLSMTCCKWDERKGKEHV